MKVIAKLKYLRMSPRKVRLVANLVKGLTVAEAEDQLIFVGKRAVLPIRKLLHSAIANAEQVGLTRSSLYIHSIIVSDGPTLKRFMPRMGGRVSDIKKRTSHIILTLEERILINEISKKSKRFRGGKAVSRKDIIPAQKNKKGESRDAKEEDVKKRPQKERFRALKKERSLVSKTPSFARRVFRRKSI